MKWPRKLSTKAVLMIVLGVVLVMYALRAAMGGGWNPFTRQFWGVSMFAAPKARLPSLRSIESGVRKASTPRVLKPYDRNGEMYTKLSWVGSAMAYHVYDRQNKGGYGLTGFLNLGYRDMTEPERAELDGLLNEELSKVGLENGASMTDTQTFHGYINSNTNAVCMVMQIRIAGRVAYVPAVCFAGTKDWTNWGSDFTASKIAATQVNRTATGQVHKGFARAYGDVKSEMRDWVRAHDKGPDAGYSPLLVCGHSLGSALSETCAYDLALDGHVVANFSMAPPRVGDPDWVEDYNAKVAYAMHFHVEGDPVPTTPPVAAGFRHTTTHYEYPVSQNIITECPISISIYRDKCRVFEDPTWTGSALKVASHATQPLTYLISRKGNCARLHVMEVYLQGVTKNANACPIS